MYDIEFSNYELFGYSVIVQNKIVKSWFGSLFISLGQAAQDNKI